MNSKMLLGKDFRAQCDRHHYIQPVPAIPRAQFRQVMSHLTLKYVQSHQRRTLFHINKNCLHVTISRRHANKQNSATRNII